MSVAPLSAAARLARDLLFREKRCLVCGVPYIPERGTSPTTPAALFCPACAQALAHRQAGFCPLCGELAAWPELPPMPCGRCLATPPPWEGFVFHAAYEGRLRQMILGLKFRNLLAWGYGLGALLAHNTALLHLFTEASPVDCIAPIPLHTSRLGERGYNQATEIARGLLSCLPKHHAITLKPELLLRTKAGPPQRSLARAERAANVRGVFTVTENLHNKRIILLDDIYTTGATLRSATETLLEAGARVDVVVVGRTPKHFWGKGFV